MKYKERYFYHVDCFDMTYYVFSKKFLPDGRYRHRLMGINFWRFDKKLMNQPGGIKIDYSL